MDTPFTNFFWFSDWERKQNKTFNLLWKGTLIISIIAVTIKTTRITKIIMPIEK